ILNMKRVPRGTSGAVSRLGSMAAAFGACMIGIGVVGLLWLDGLFAEAVEQTLRIVASPILIGIALVAGFLGAMVDSILGATIQSMRRCSRCGHEVEPLLHCDVPSVHIRGWSWMNNDVVNVISSAVGGGIAVIIGI